MLTGKWGAISAGLYLMLSMVQWYLIANRGQSLGKMVAKTRSELLDGGAVGFLHGVALRAWIPLAIGFVPPFGGIFGLIDPLFIFGKRRRCLHDLIAGTKVVYVSEASAQELKDLIARYGGNIARVADHCGVDREQVYRWLESHCIDADLHRAEPKPAAAVPDKEELEAALREAKGKVATLAERYGRHPQQIYRWLKQYGLSADDYR